MHLLQKQQNGEMTDVVQLISDNSEDECGVYFATCSHPLPKTSAFVHFKGIIPAYMSEHLSTCTRVTKLSLGLILTLTAYLPGYLDPASLSPPSTSAC
jgi:hypothetical protein